MPFQTLNPTTGELLEQFSPELPSQMQQKLERVTHEQARWQTTTLAQRQQWLANLADLLDKEKAELAQLITLEMGKIYRESVAEIDKSVEFLRWSVDQAPAVLSTKPYTSQAKQSYVHYQPLGTVLAIMPWNYPLWQVIRLLAPALLAGNTLLLKPAGNVPQCTQALERLTLEAGLPANVFAPLYIEESEVQLVIAHPKVRSVHLTGSTRAGRAVGTIAGRHLKKCVMELGGSDPFIILEDADLPKATAQALASRFLNNGQSCLSAKRFIIAEGIYEPFKQAFCEGIERLTMGDPLKPETDLGPMARRDLLTRLDTQIDQSRKGDAEVLRFSHSNPQDLAQKGFFHPPCIIENPQPGTPAWDDELFGPVATFFKAKNPSHAIALANDTPYGLGGSVWSENESLAIEMAHGIESGATAINRMLRSDIRMPFGGFKNSGFGREMGDEGFYELTNPKSIFIW